ncbi:hypothetical protein DM01DRAFT_1297210 [Hesseltinella vesiculosa]|uniref:Dienelactone hydrolase domain-containing protein n=1 Tax=Hesseltinella vesiculosa TaxID=101127 RepID=A0A1X2GY24_9FUNG|nr:hypothetical protein DM01DRAFT_1297210 [Hesseltinella vesiculosa]
MASTYSKACCNTKPVTADYTPVGSFDQIGDMRVYVTGPSNAKHAVIFAYDILGMTPQAQQFADRMASKCGFKVAVPDLLQNHPFDMSLVGRREELFAWIQRVGSLELMKGPLNNTIDWLREGGAVDTGMVGLCWGAKIAVQFSALETSGFIKAIAQVHPSMVDDKDAEACPVPNLLIPTKDEPDMLPYYEILKSKSFGDQCEHYRFDGKFHGFAGARGDYNDELNRKRATEAIDLTSSFLCKVVKGESC